MHLPTSRWAPWRAAILWAFLSTAVAGITAARAAEPLVLGDGDRVVLIGSTFIEREQSHGYVETALASRFPGAAIQFRNLGWSGDNVWGEARAGFGTIDQGFQHLKEHVLELRPTVILLNYGANEAFEGEAGLQGFLAGLDTLLAMLDETGAKIVFLTPPPQEKLGPPLPDPAVHNRELKRYGDAIAKVAAARDAPVVNLFELLNPKSLADLGGPLTDNGMHLTAYGYWRAAPRIEQGLGHGARHWQVQVTATRGNIEASGTRIQDASVSPEEIRFVARDALLPLAPAPNDAPETTGGQSHRVLRVFDLSPGEYQLTVDGEPLVAADAVAWARGVPLAGGPEADQTERLRQTIRAKNELYFHRWRPQNVTYLFGFRKHEQGNNAVEIPQFDPLVEAREQEIRTLSVPVAHEYRLVKVKP